MKYYVQYQMRSGMRAEELKSEAKQLSRARALTEREGRAVTMLTYDTSEQGMFLVKSVPYSKAAFGKIAEPVRTPLPSRTPTRRRGDYFLPRR